MSASVGSVGSVWGGGVSMCAFGEVSGEVAAGRAVPSRHYGLPSGGGTGSRGYRLSAASTVSHRLSYQGRCAACGPFGAAPAREPSWTI
ncbi:hypothetical protein Scani_66250 [Streptomyces caniferus]|uniref:Uncharacterized protein n=1 Tax=Streptomyces caniferus TaxID=285557 RepID=A0A640SGI2_9ACTN|nr:hypothetical protein Scani_66250 [Streptomyces caniferus]